MREKKEDPLVEKDRVKDARDERYERERERKREREKSQQ